MMSQPLKQLIWAPDSCLLMTPLWLQSTNVCDLSGYSFKTISTTITTVCYSGGKITFVWQKELFPWKRKVWLPDDKSCLDWMEIARTVSLNWICAEDGAAWAESNPHRYTHRIFEYVKTGKAAGPDGLLPPPLESCMLMPGLGDYRPVALTCGGSIPANLDPPQFAHWSNWSVGEVGTLPVQHVLKHLECRNAIHWLQPLSQLWQ